MMIYFATLTTTLLRQHASWHCRRMPPHEVSSLNGKLEAEHHTAVKQVSTANPPGGRHLHAIACLVMSERDRNRRIGCRRKHKSVDGIEWKPKNVDTLAKHMKPFKADTEPTR